MPVPFPVSKVWSDNQKVKFLTIFGRPKTRFSDKISAEFRNFPQFPLATNHADYPGRAPPGLSPGSSPEVSPGVPQGCPPGSGSVNTSEDYRPT